VSALWLLLVGPVRMDYDQVFALRSRVASPFRAQLVLWAAIHGLWLLQSLDLLVDEYPPRPSIRSAMDEPEFQHRRVG